jgi:hypothetical protein
LTGLDPALVQGGDECRTWFVTSYFR